MYQRPRSLRGLFFGYASDGESKPGALANTGMGEKKIEDSAVMILTHTTPPEALGAFFWLLKYVGPSSMPWEPLEQRYRF